MGRAGVLLIIVAFSAGCGSSKPRVEPAPRLEELTKAPPVAKHSFPACPTVAPVSSSSATPPTGSSEIAELVDTVIAANRFRFKTCYDQALASDPTVAGIVRVGVHVAIDGAVTSEVQCTDLPDTLALCVAHSFVDMPFPKPDGGPATFTAPVVFSVRKKKR